jgi:hypothetical protein
MYRAASYPSTRDSSAYKTDYEDDTSIKQDKQALTQEMLRIVFAIAAAVGLILAAVGIAGLGAH